MVSANLPVAHRTHPDSVRIAAYSAAIVINIAVLLIALRPLAPQIMQRIEEALPTQVRIIQKEIPPPPPPAIEIEKVQPKATPHARQQQVVTPPATVPTSEGRVETPPVTPVSIAPSDATPVAAVSVTPIEATLAYRSAPLSFPTQALRQRLHGTVLLRVLVNEDGKPVDVAIEQSCGSPLLDRSAREQVLAKWTFQPAMVQGQHVRAWARVPVTFDLRDL
ncbi:energy transducer TonB [Dyella tabacisoli]|uniref:Energy transducer TonB n=1 Tax=Dyella tabacisoli TaxID=2282381 RepID=A0A369UPT6_9GAMM|nr:energy transducer TonB [Dyella tabacisoli]RDD82764.1 energy transducer TonB [Dyella tabacisoli]